MTKRRTGRDFNSRPTVIAHVSGRTAWCHRASASTPEADHRDHGSAHVCGHGAHHSAHDHSPPHWKIRSMRYSPTKTNVAAPAMNSNPMSAIADIVMTRPIRPLAA
jgi:hypothetical protein